MPNYDTKLGEWFKQVEQRAEELLAKRRGGRAPQEAEGETTTPQQAASVEAEPAAAPRPGVVPETPRADGGSRSGGIPSTSAAPSGRVSTPPDGPSGGIPDARREEVVTARAPEISARPDGIPEPRPEEARARAESPVLTAVDEREAPVADEREPAERATERQDSGPALFEDAELSPVEDFFSFLSRSGARERERQEEQPLAADMPEDQGMLTLAEGTGTPRPIAPADEEPSEPPAAAAEPRPTPEPQPAAKVEPTAAKAEPPRVKAEQPKQADEESTAEQKWERVPQHLRILFDGEAEEIAQHSYKTFRESRAGLIERLLDPSISLEDAARILNVCPTTVRRYTNRGILKHYRTAGNQRRFKLSDVLSFMESRQ